MARTAQLTVENTVNNAVAAASEDFESNIKALNAQIENEATPEFMKAALMLARTQLVKDEIKKLYAQIKVARGFLPPKKTRKPKAA